MTEQWAPIQYRDFHDVPRAFVVEHEGDLLLFDCPFFEVIDDYGTEFTVFKIRKASKDQVDQPSWADLRRSGDRVGTVPVNAVRFDDTRREAIDTSVFQLLAERQRATALVHSMVAQFPELRPLHQEHLNDHRETLSHVFFGDLTRYVVALLGRNDPASIRAAQNLLDFLDTAYTTGSENEQELIHVSFLENLPEPGEPGANIRDMLGPALRKQLLIMHWWNLEQGFKHVLDALSPQFAPQAFAEVRYLVDHNEFGLAMETLIHILSEAQRPIPFDVVEHIKRLADSMGMPEDQVPDWLRG